MFAIWLGLTVANIAGIWLFSATVAEAADRSFFQAIAIVVVWFFGYRRAE